jgi:hypothetical protein
MNTIHLGVVETYYNFNLPLRDMKDWAETMIQRHINDPSEFLELEGVVDYDGGHVRISKYRHETEEEKAVRLAEIERFRLENIRQKKLKQFNKLKAELGL